VATARVFVDSVQAAAETLVVVLEHARANKHDYVFGPINADIVVRSGLYLEGEIEKVLEEVLEVSGAVLTT
jgi:hypothetical protein